MTALTERSAGLWTRHVPSQLSLSNFKLMAFDMDSTLINIECIDEMAAMVGLQKEVSAITEAAMRGEISDYKESLRQRVSLLKGAPVSIMQTVYDEKLQLNPGVEQVVAQCHRLGLHTLIVSGGFDYFTQRLQQQLGIHETRSNQLEVKDGCFTGRVSQQSWGDICDGEEKKKMVLLTAHRLGIQPEECIAVGDGSNDLPMMSVCGLSVAYHAKPKVRAQANIVIDSGGLDRMFEVVSL
ncbi:MAG: phosphoserine phosphatase SerB [Limnohabitans sp.]